MPAEPSTVTTWGPVVTLPLESTQVHVTTVWPSGKTTGALLETITTPQLSAVNGVPRVTPVAPQELLSETAVKSAGANHGRFLMILDRHRKAARNAVPAGVRDSENIGGGPGWERRPARQASQLADNLARAIVTATDHIDDVALRTLSEIRVATRWPGKRCPALPHPARSPFERT